MTRIDFYTHVNNRLDIACQLTLKAYRQGLRVLILTPDAHTSEGIDRELWCTPATGFVPHCMRDHALAEQTPVLIDHAMREPLHDDVLLNLRPELPPFFSRFQRLLEIVDAADDSREDARGRYRFYRDRGYEIHSHDVSKTSVARATMPAQP